MRFFFWLAVAAALACSRTGLDVFPLGAEGGPASCAADAGVTVGTPARTSTTAQTGTIVIDPDDDLLLVFGGLSGDGVAAKAITGVKLGTGEPVTLTRTGDSSVALGISGRAVWDPFNHRVIVLGDSLSFYDPSQPPDLHQVFSAKVQGTNVELHALSTFSGSETGDIALPAAIDPIAKKLLVMPETGGVSGPLKTWALDLGSDQWSVFHEDDNPAVQNLEITSLTYDAGSRRVLGVAKDQMWALALDAPSGWMQIQGTFPPIVASYANVLGGGPVFVWDDDLCAYVTAFTDDSCLYQVWRADIGASAFTMTSLGLATQTSPRYGRGMGAFDAHRRNFVFGSAFDCQDEHEYLAASTDFLPVVP